MPKLPGVNHRQAVRALKKSGFSVVRALLNVSCKIETIFYIAKRDQSLMLQVSESLAGRLSCNLEVFLDRLTERFDVSGSFPVILAGIFASRPASIFAQYPGPGGGIGRHKGLKIPRG